MTDFDNTLPLEFPICADHGIWIDNQFHGKFPHRRKLLACLNGAGRDGMFYLLHQLEIDGGA